MTMVSSCWLVSSLSVAELFVGMPFRSGIEDTCNNGAGTQISFRRVEMWACVNFTV